jgi:hypothetical protein
MGDAYLLIPQSSLQVVSARDGSPVHVAHDIPGRVWMDGLMANHDFAVKWSQNMEGEALGVPDLSGPSIQLPPKPAESNAAIHGNVLYMHPGGGELEAIDLETGAVLARWPTYSEFGSWICVDAQHLYFCSDDGSVQAFPLLSVPPH